VSGHEKLSDLFGTSSSFEHFHPERSSSSALQSETLRARPSPQREGYLHKLLPVEDMSFEGNRKERFNSRRRSCNDRNRSRRGNRCDGGISHRVHRPFNTLPLNWRMILVSTPILLNSSPSLLDEGHDLFAQLQSLQAVIGIPRRMRRSAKPITPTRSSDSPSSWLRSGEGVSIHVDHIVQEMDPSLGHGTEPFPVHLPFLTMLARLMDPKLQDHREGAAVHHKGWCSPPGRCEVLVLAIDPIDKDDPGSRSSRRGTLFCRRRPSMEGPDGFGRSRIAERVIHPFLTASINSSVAPRKC